MKSAQQLLKEEAAETFAKKYGRRPADELELKLHLQMLATEAEQAKHGPAGYSQPIADRLPASVKAVLDGSGRVFNPKLWGADLPNFRAPKFERKSWLAKAREASKRRLKGDVLRPLMDRAWEILAWWDKDHDGQVQLGMALWSKMVGCCIETIRKIVRFGEREDVLNTFNMPKRATGEVKREANVYHLVPPTMPPVVIPDDVAPELKPLARAQAWCARWAPYFRLVPRAFGLNTTPLRSRMERNPRPA